MLAKVGLKVHCDAVNTKKGARNDWMKKKKYQPTDSQQEWSVCLAQRKGRRWSKVCFDWYSMVVVVVGRSKQKSERISSRVGVSKEAVRDDVEQHARSSVKKKSSVRRII